MKRLNHDDQLALQNLLFEQYQPEDIQFDIGGAEEEPVFVMELEPEDEPAEIHSHSYDNDTVCIELKKIVEYGSRLLEMASECEMEPWMIAKLSKAADYVDDVYYQLESKVDFANRGVFDVE